MKTTSVGVLLGTAAFVAAAVAIVMPVAYGRMFAIPATVSLSLWGMAVVCAVLALKVRAAKKDEAHGIGLDRSQLNPLTVANFLLVGKASAWTGTIVGAAYAGMCIYVVPRAGELVAAAADAPGTIASALGGAAMAVAGVVLERHCEVPPPTDGVSAVS